MCKWDGKYWSFRAVIIRDPELARKEIVPYYFQFKRAANTVQGSKLAVLRANLDHLLWFALVCSGSLSRAQSLVSLAHLQLRLKQQQLRSKGGSRN